MRQAKGHGGFTLVEALTALVVLGIAVGAILTPIVVAVEQKTRTMKQTLAVQLAEQLIEECLAQTNFSFDDWPVLGPSANETWRNLYDERSDYHNIAEGAAQFGTRYGVRLGASDFPPNMTRRFWLQQVYLPGQTVIYPPQILMLTVRVYDGDEELVTLRRFIYDDDYPYP